MISLDKEIFSMDYLVFYGVSGNILEGTEK